MIFDSVRSVWYYCCMNCHEKSKFQRLEKLVNGEDVVLGVEVSFFLVVRLRRRCFLTFQMITALRDVNTHDVRSWTFYKSLSLEKISPNGMLILQKFQKPFLMKRFISAGHWYDEGVWSSRNHFKRIRFLLWWTETKGERQRVTWNEFFSIVFISRRNILVNWSLRRKWHTRIHAVFFRLEMVHFQNKN